MEFLQLKLSSSVVLLAASICCILVSFGDSSTTPVPHQTCSSITGSCEECLKNVSCLWCYTTNVCLDYPVRNVLPPSIVCRLSDARWGVCWVNFEAMIIAMAVVGGIISTAITICCCCCCCGCCCRKRSSGPDRDEERMARRREERMQRLNERKAEKKTKHDEIRKKYGLLSNSDHPYSRFEND
ncbi:pituitary tumor-transforming gene 1 protein-interacting protein-like [Acipenser oxyrinchus oxyrinchus]|uniref:Pituitary tumor-transforming gene 1 protein-interacting protein-like n=1 Tax=Acipenser oxyrinchus oxyrinchus TaxID=40147 RepID=A0AAD8LRW8_ACIOX|nr:pituitary tumor-transforming gene 1 protein-interacting protein-like [Acipenser oxyrinchus oxyrinchus]